MDGGGGVGWWRGRRGGRGWKSMSRVRRYPLNPQPYVPDPLSSTLHPTIEHHTPHIETLIPKFQTPYSKP